MRYLFLILILIPTPIALAQTPTPTPDPDEAAAAKFKISVLEIKLQRLQNHLNQIRGSKKAEREGGRFTTRTPAQKAAMKTERQAKIQQLRGFCDGIRNLRTNKQ